MYCGMAVRTALAIGLPTSAMADSIQSRKAARRTWWYVADDICLSMGTFLSVFTNVSFKVHLFPGNVCASGTHLLKSC